MTASHPGAYTTGRFLTPENSPAASQKPGHKFETIATDKTTTIAVDTDKNTWIWGGDEWTRKNLSLDGDGTKPAKYQTGIAPVKTIGVDEGSF